MTPARKPSPTGATACKLRRSTRRNPGRGFHVFKALRPSFPGDRNGRAGVGARTRQRARRHTQGARPARYGAIPERGDGLRASAIDPKSRARNSMFSRLCGRFSGRLDRPDRPRRQGPSKRTPLDPGRRGSALRGGPRPRRQAVRFGDRLGKIPGADSMFSRACGRFSGRSQQPGGHQAPGPGKAHAVSRKGARPRAGVAGRCPTAATACALRGHADSAEGSRARKRMCSRPCRTGLDCGRPQRPDGRRSHDPSKRTPSSQGRPASALRGDVRPGRRPARFGDRAGEIPGADSMFSRTCGGFSGRS